jgi:two-component system, sensor histidine kinase and response regulator
MATSEGPEPDAADAAMDASARTTHPSGDGIDPWFDALPVAAMRIDADGRITGFNAALRAYRQVPPSQLPQRWDQAVECLGLRDLDGVLLEASATPLGQAMQGQVPEPISLRLGLEGPTVEVRTQRVCASNGRGLGVVMTFVAYPAEPATTAVTAPSDRDLERVMRHTPGFFFRASDQPGFPLLYVSDAIEALTGHPAGSFVTGARTLLDVIVEDDHAACIAAVAEAARSGAQARVEFRIRHLDATVRWMQTVAVRVRLADGAGVFEALALDVTAQKDAEAAYAKAHARLVALFQQSAQMQAQLAGDGSVVELNDRALQHSDWPREASVGKRFWEAPWWSALPDERDRVEQAVHRAIQGRPARIRCRYHVLREGALRLRHGDLSAVPVLDAEGRLLNVWVTAVDITDSEQARVALADSEARLRLLMTNSPGVVFRCEIDPACRIDFVSQGIERLSGFTADEFTSGRRTWMSLIHAEDVETVRAQIQSQARAGDVLELRYRVQHRDGRTLWCDVHAHRTQGQTFEGVVLDVNARRLAERALADSQARYRAIFDVSPLMLWRAGPDGVLDDFNQAGLDYLGVDQATLRSRGWLHYVHADDVPGLVATWQQCIGSGTALEAEFRKRRHDGHYRWMQTRALPQRNAEGQITSWIGANADIDDVKRAQEVAEAAAQAKSQFLANMSHEIRTPMNGVIGMASLLQETPLNDLQREYVHTIRTSGEHLLALINDILDFSKADAGRLELESYAFDLRTCVEEAMELVAPGALPKQLDITLDASPELPDRITGDAGRLRQIMVNLLSNAIKFTEQGEIRVEVDVVEPHAGPRPWKLAFTVRDTGIGIPAERLDRLFGMFSQVDASHSRIYGGSGLGLAICKRLVEQMGGRIEVQSQPGRGSTFRFEILAGAAPPETDKPTRRFDGVRALIVDDHPTNRRILRATLEAVGVAVTEAVGGPAALACIEHQTFDVALFDYQMPGMTGIELAQAMRDRGAMLPLILLGSSTAALTPAPALFAARLLKPLRRATLYDQLDIVLRRTASDMAPTTAETTVRSPSAVRILVAEDNTVNQRVAMHFLRRLGYRADVVADGLEAVDAVRRQRYDIVLMDVQMPRMDGLEAAAVIRRECVPGPYIIAVTADVLPQDEQRCRDAGMQDFLTKPLSLSTLDAALARAAASIPASGSAVLGGDFDPAGLAEVVRTYELDGARELISTMRASLPQEVELLRAAIAQHDARVASRLCHTWKGHCRLFHAMDLASRCEAAEQAAKQSDGEAMGEQIDVLVMRFTALLERLAHAVADA